MFELLYLPFGLTLLGLFVMLASGREVPFPQCRRCRYNLTGLEGASQCPECGSALNSRNRLEAGDGVMRRIQFSFGLVVFLLGAAGIAAIVWHLYVDK